MNKTTVKFPRWLVLRVRYGKLSDNDDVRYRRAYKLRCFWVEIESSSTEWSVQLFYRRDQL